MFGIAPFVARTDVRAIHLPHVAARPRGRKGYKKKEPALLMPLPHARYSTLAHFSHAADPT
jgi:hypothetical protein